MKQHKMLAFGDSFIRRSWPLGCSDTLEEMFLERNSDAKYVRKVTRSKVTLAYASFSCDQLILSYIHYTTKMCTLVLKFGKREKVKYLDIFGKKEKRRS